MESWNELYQEVILDHNKKPRNKGKLMLATHSGEGYNPLCGDQVELMLKLENNVIQDVCFEGHGCAISTASASMMTEAIKGKTIEEALSLSSIFRRCVTEESASCAGLGAIEVLQGVKQFPMRVKCATLAWHTLDAALKQNQSAVTTEG